MGLKTFIGGVHPYEGKELAKDAPIKEVLPKGELVFPLSQHIGAPATPIVAVGDSVKKGQKIAEAGGFVSSPIYSSVSGTVKKIEPRRVAVGDMVNSIVIESDDQFTECEYSPVDDVTSLSREKIIDRIKEAGVVGMGGAGFPTHVKLSPKEPEKIEYIIANCAECEPYLTADYRRMIENPEDLVAGMKIILQLFDHAKGVFGVENNKPDAIAKLKELIKDEPRMEVCELLTKYPQGELCKEIGVVQQRSILFKGSIRENLKWGNEQASDEELWNAITIAQAKDVVESKPGKLDFVVEQNGRNLSGGQKQRLTIARALVGQPKILILDDSLSALDFATDAALRKAIGGLKGNMTTFLVSQRISGIRQADKILVMEDGALAGQGTHEELMKSCKTYQEIYYSQFPEERPEEDQKGVAE